MKSSLKTSSLPGRVPGKKQNSLLKSDFVTNNSPEKSELIKGVLKKNGYISESIPSETSTLVYDDVFVDGDMPHGSAIETAFQELDCSHIQDLSRDGKEFDFAVETMLCEDRQESSGSRVSESLLKPTVAYIEGQYKGKKPDGIWRPPEGIISPPSAKLCRSTKAVESHKYDETKRPVTPSKEKDWVTHVSKEKVIGLVHTQADAIFKEDRILRRNLKRDDIKNDPFKPTAAAISARYKKADPNLANAGIWHAPEVILPPSEHLLKTTSSREVSKWTGGDPTRPKTPEAKREKGWKKSSQENSLNTLSLASSESGRSRTSSRSKSAERTVLTNERINALCSPNANFRSSIEALEKAKLDKEKKTPKKQKIMTNQRVLNPTLANIYSQEDLKNMRHSIKPEDDPWWDKREGKVIPRCPSSSKYASIESKLEKPTAASLSRFFIQSLPTQRAKSPSPFISPDDPLLRSTTKDRNRNRATSEMRSLSARSNISRSTSVASTSERSQASSAVSDRLLSPTDSFNQYRNSRLKPQEQIKPQDKRPVSPNLIHRLETKTASIAYSQWKGSSAEMESVLAFSRHEKMMACAERAERPNRSLTSHTRSSINLSRTKSPGRKIERDPADVGNGWVSSTASRVDDSDQSISELTSLNYQNRTLTPRGGGSHSGSNKKENVGVSNSLLCAQLERLHLHSSKPRSKSSGNGSGASSPSQLTSGRNTPISESSVALA